MTQTFITYELDGNVALIGLKRPEKRNAMHTALFEELGEAVCLAGREASVGVIYGHGEQFSAGLDLAHAAKWLQSMDPVERKRRPDPSRFAFNEISRGAIPFVAALHGAVIGAGLELAASAHIRVADDSTFFALPEAVRGIFVGGGGSVRIQRLIGYPRMADMMLTGRSYTAEEAERINLVQYHVAVGDALSKARELAGKIAANATLSNWAITNVLPRINDIPDDDGLFFETLAANFVVTEDSEKRLLDFLEKRAPSLRE